MSCSLGVGLGVLLMLALIGVRRGGCVMSVSLVGRGCGFVCCVVTGSGVWSVVWLVVGGIGGSGWWFIMWWGCRLVALIGWVTW